MDVDPSMMEMGTSMAAPPDRQQQAMAIVNALRNKPQGRMVGKFYVPGSGVSPQTMGDIMKEQQQRNMPDPGVF